MKTPAPTRTDMKFRIVPNAIPLCAIIITLALALCDSTPAQAAGGIVPDRSTLDSILAGYGPLTENFEAINLPPDVGQVGPPVLSSNISYYGFGSGLVVPGVTFSSIGGVLQWNSEGYFGQPSKDINSSSTTLQINFTAPTPAFGLDLLVFAGFGDDANVSVYGADDATLLASFSGISLSDPSSPVFFGYQDASGIGMVQIQGTDHSWSPLIDNLTFAVVPEPSATALLALAFSLAAMGVRQRMKDLP